MAPDGSAYFRQQQQDDDEIDLGQVLATLWAGKIRIIVFTVIAVAIGAAHVARTPPTYQADALLQLEERGGQLALPEGMRDLIDNEARTGTEIEVIRSRMVLGDAVAELNLDWQARPDRAPLIGYVLERYDLPLPEIEYLEPYTRGDAAIELSLLELPPPWIGQPMSLTNLGDGAYALALPNGQEVRGQVGDTLSDETLGYALRVDSLSGREGRTFTIAQRGLRSAVGSLRDGLTISERGRQSGILELRYASGDPEQAERNLNAILRAYVRQNVARSAAEAEQSLEFIEGQLPEAEARVREAEAALNAYRQEQQSIDLDFETQNLLTQITRLERELREIDEREDELSERYTENHPAYQQLLNQRARIEQQLEELRAEVDQLPGTQREVLNLTRELEIAQEVYSQLLARAQEMRVLRASTVGNVRVLDSAETAPNPVAPRRNLILALAAVLGTMTGVGAVLVANWMRKGVQGAEDLEQIGLPVFSTILFTPKAAASDRQRRKPGILALTDPNDAAVEGFRSLRTSMHFGMLDAQTKSIVLTSSAPDAGKSFSCVNLAAVTAKAGQSVCLVDADLRRGALRKFFGLPRNQPGLAELLAGEKTLDEVLVAGPIEGLYMIPSGRFPPNPSELLMRSALPDLVSELDSRFDLSIFDAPPVLAVTDSVIIGRAVGSTIIVVRHDATPIGEVQAVRRTLETSGITPSGAILNGFDPKRAKAGYRYGYYGYNYRYEYRSKSEET